MDPHQLPAPQPPHTRPILSYVVPAHRPVRGLELLALLGIPLAIGFAAVMVFAIYIALAGAEHLMSYAVPISIGAGGLALVGTMLFQKWTPADLALNPLRRSAVHLMWQVPAIMIACGVVSALSSLAVPQPETSDPENMAENFSLGIGAIVVTVLGMALIGPIIEEIIFRRFIMGYLDQLLVPRMKALTAIVLSSLISSAIFGLVHGVPSIMIYTFVLGCGAAYIIRQHQTLWAGIILHCANNTMVAIAALSIFLTT